MRCRERRDAVVDFDGFYPRILVGLFYDFAGDVVDGIFGKVVLMNLEFCGRLFEYDGGH